MAGAGGRSKGCVCGRCMEAVTSQAGGAASLPRLRMLKSNCAHATCSLSLWGEYSSGECQSASHCGAITMLCSTCGLPCHCTAWFTHTTSAEAMPAVQSPWLRLCEGRCGCTGASGVCHCHCGGGLYKMPAVIAMYCLCVQAQLLCATSCQRPAGTASLC